MTTALGADALAEDGLGADALAEDGLGEDALDDTAFADALGPAARGDAFDEAFAAAGLDAGFEAAFLVVVAFRTEERAAAPAGRRRSAALRFVAVRAGLRADVRDLVTRRDFAIGIYWYTFRADPGGTVTNRRAGGQDLRPKTSY